LKFDLAWIDGGSRAYVQAAPWDFLGWATVSFCYARERAGSSRIGMWREEVTAALRSAAALPTALALTLGRAGGAPARAA